jgi:hypothetical protein
MESIFKMAILRLSTRPSEPRIFIICRPTIFKFWIFLEEWHVWVFWFIIYELWNLARTRTLSNKFFLSYFITFWVFFRSLLNLELIQWYILVVQIIKKIDWSKKQNGGPNQNGHQAWIFHCSVNFRTIWGPKIENGVYRRWYNHELERESLTAWMSKMSRRQADCATLVTWSEDPKTYKKKLYSEPNPTEGGIKEDRNPGGRKGWTAMDALCSRQAVMERSSWTDLNQILVVVPHK